MARYDDLNTRSIGYAALVSTIILLLIILALRALCYGWIEGEVQRKLANAHYPEADAVLEEQRELLETYGKNIVELPPPPDKPDAEPQKVERLRIPVDRAAQLFLQELNQEQQQQRQAQAVGKADPSA
ncbi:MAG: hypothetical protein D6753_05100 [Planctomycetota bacterium]|nr:MAG: hypothetical protein D6753_05100 [Planctomycetota bacterium]